MTLLKTFDEVGWLSFQAEQGDRWSFDIEYDCAVGGASWDPRSLDILNAPCTYRIMVGYKNRGTTGTLDDHEQSIRDHGVDVAVFIDPPEVAISTAAVLSELEKRAQAHRRPLRVAIELAGLPRSISMGLLSLLLQRGLASRVDFLYREALYPPSEKSGGHFYSGPARLRDVPGFPGSQSPGRLDHYVVSIGFAGMSTHDALTAIDPSRLTILLADPGTEPGYAAEAIAANATLLAEFGTAGRPRDPELRAPAGDVGAAWARLRTFRECGGESMNWAYAMCGSKPHSLAMALDALTAGSPRLLYMNPYRHEECQVIPQPEMWQYAIENRAHLGRRRT